MTANGVQTAVDMLVQLSSNWLLPFMLAVFSFGVIFRFLVYFTLRRQEQFSIEFEKRKNAALQNNDIEPCFYLMCKKLLVKTFYEMFVLQALLQRRKADPVMTLTDRIFLIRSGFAWLVKDVLRQIRYMRYDGKELANISVVKNTFEQNPFFNNVFGRISCRMVTDLVNILPGLFIIGGIFGTFLGIMTALPDLGALKPADPEISKVVIDQFMLKVSFAMSTSIVGILLSVMMTLVNVLFSPQKVFVRTVDRFDNALNNLWAVCEHNSLPAGADVFDEHKNPIEALGELSVDKEVSKWKKEQDERVYNFEAQKTQFRKAG